MKQAKTKVWLTVDRKLVKDGHDDAKFLFAIEGQMVPDSYVEEFDNASTFFKDANQPHPEPGAPAPRADETVPGQSNSPEVKEAPKDKVGSVKVIGDHEAAVGSEPPPKSKTAKSKKKK